MAMGFMGLPAKFRRRNGPMASMNPQRPRCWQAAASPAEG